MGTIKLNTLQNKLFVGIFALLFLFSFDMSAEKVKFKTSLVVPATSGYAKVNKGNNNNYTVKIRISDLAEIQRLYPAEQTYVVWMTTNKGTAKNLGILESSKAFLSNKLKASLETVSSIKPIQIFITAEDEAGIQYPSTQEMLITDRFED